MELPKNKKKPQIDEIEDPFRYQFKVVKNDKSKIINVDLIESFNYLMGIIVEKIERIKKNGRVYIIITGKAGEVQVGIVWRNVIDIDLVLDKKIIEVNLNDAKLDVLFINNRCLIKSAKSIEAELSHLI